MDVKSRIMTEISTPKGPNANRKHITIGKYPSIGIDCRRSMKGVRTSDAALFVAANMPKETPQAIEIKSVAVIRNSVLKVCNGRYLTSGYLAKVTINQATAERMINPMTKLSMYLRKLDTSAWPNHNNKNHNRAI